MLDLCLENGAEASREFHYMPQTNGFHFLFAHGEAASRNELITDLCPWQFTAENKNRGAYHGTRIALEQMHAIDGDGSQGAALKSLSTLTARNTPSMRLDKLLGEIKHRTPDLPLK